MGVREKAALSLVRLPAPTLRWTGSKYGKRTKGLVSPHPNPLQYFARNTQALPVRGPKSPLAESRGSVVASEALEHKEYKTIA